MTEPCPTSIDPFEFGKVTQALTDLTKLVTLGFDGVNDRLDKQNGRIGKGEDRIADVETWQSNRTFLEKISVTALKLVGIVTGLVVSAKALGLI